MNKNELIQLLFDIQNYRRNYDENPTIAEKETKTAINYVLEHHNHLPIIDDEIFVCFKYILSYIKEYQIGGENVLTLKEKVSTYSKENLHN